MSHVGTQCSSSTGTLFGSSAISFRVTTPSVLKYTTYDVEDKSIRINLLVLNVISIF
jgi:hypothetical protein